MRWLPLLTLLAAACGRDPIASPDAAGADAGAPDADLGPDSEISTESLVYAHSGPDLYRIDTNNLDVIHIGAFGGNNLTDIAVDKDGGMVGVSFGKLWSIDPGTGVATEIAAFDGQSDSLTSLSYVPVDPNDPDSAERLVTAGKSGDVYEVDPTTGAATVIGNYGLSNGMQICSSGDIVSVRGLGTLATVTVGCPVFTGLDYLATVDPTTWEVTLIGTESTGFDKIFGLGFWGGTIFGFVDAEGPDTGTMITIDPVTGVGTPAVSSTFDWYGAGVTTVAPIVD